jgi:hypothetical protein
MPLSFFDPFAKATRSQTIFWFCLSLMFAAICAFLILQRAFEGEYVVQDDARQHVFWMQRFTDPQLFPNDLIADYFQSLAPWGYTYLYRSLAAIGVDPLLLSKLLPVPLSLVAAAYAFGVGMQLLPVPLTGFVASLLTTQVLWTHDDVVSATPRAFLPALFMAFLYYLLKRQETRSLWKAIAPCIVAIVLEGLFYPQYVLVFAGIIVLQLVVWQQGRLRLSSGRRDYLFCGICLVVAFLVLLPTALSNSEYGSVISGATARQLLEFSDIGRSQFFVDDPLEYWLWADRSGIFPAFRPQFLAIGFLLPLLLGWARYAPAQIPLRQQMSPKTGILLQIILVSFFLFFAAHGLLFKLYLPSRYTNYTLRFVLVFAAAITVTLLLNALWSHQHRARTYRRALVWGITIALCGGLIFYPSYAKSQARESYSEGDEPQVYQFFAQQPKQIRIASVVRAADNIPTFAGRSLFVGREYALSYHTGYGQQMRQRAIATIQAQYSLEPKPLVDFIQTHRIDFWILDREESFQPRQLQKAWIRQYPQAFRQAIRHLRQGTPVLKKMIRPCTVSRDKDLQVLSTACILQEIQQRDRSVPPASIP